MFRKIHSNRDPRDTVFREIKKEFRPYFDKAGQGLKKTADRYPKFLFWMMVINISLSIILVRTVFRPKGEPKKAPVLKSASPLSGGFDQIMRVGNALRVTISLKKQVDSLAHQKILSKADSAVLLKDLDSLQHIRVSLSRPPAKPAAKYPIINH